MSLKNGNGSIKDRFRVATMIPLLYNLVLRGAIVNRTYGTHKTYIFPYLLQQYLVLFTRDPRSSRSISSSCYLGIGDIVAESVSITGSHSK